VHHNYRNYTLPEFRSDDIEGWFAAVEMVFLEHGVVSEESKFNKLLTILSPIDFGNVRDIILGAQPNKYTLAKQRLVSIYAQTAQQRIESLLQGTLFPPNTPPSTILRFIRNRVGTEVNSDSLIRSFWMKYLPDYARAVLVSVEREPLDRQAEIADSLCRIALPTQSNSVPVLTQSNAAVTAMPQLQVAAVSAQPSLEAKFDNLLSVFMSLQTQVSAITSERQSRQRNRSPSSSRNYYKRDRSNRSRSRYQEFSDGLCYYHHTYGNKAHKCRSGCKHFGQTSSGN
jgi:hypothetical protein